MAVSYRRKKDYAKQFDWTYELNNDLCKCYLRAKENKSIMKRMKNYWDEIYAEHSFLTSKLLRDQASRVAKNKVVMATEHRNEQDTNIVPLQDNEILVEQHPQKDNMNENLIDNTNVNVESDNNEIIKTDLHKTLNDRFIQKINQCSTVDVNNRPYLTSINKKPSAEELKTIDFIATKYILTKIVMVT